MRGDMILLPTQSLEIHGTHFIDLEVRTGESTVGPWSQVIVFEYGNPELAIQHPNHYAFFLRIYIQTVWNQHDPSNCS